MRRILITGASGGIGRALALALAGPAADLILTGRRDTALKSIADEVRAQGARVSTHLLELASAENVAALGQSVASEQSSLDVLILNAAVIKLGTIADSEISDLDWHHSVNVKAPVILTRSVLGAVRQARGQFVFINSAAGLVARKGAAFYAASKHALKAVADSLREEVSAAGVTVLSVFPSRTNTLMQQRVLEMEGATADVAKFLQPDSVARIIVAAMERCRNGEINNISIPIGEEPRGW